MSRSSARWWARLFGVTAGRKRRPTRLAAEVEALEGRQVLSMMPIYGPGMGGTGSTQQATRPHEMIRVGKATKTPAFYEFYTGRQDPGLNAREATARVTGKGLELTGTMQGKINTRPTSDAQDSFYVFGINRGSSKAIAPFPSRPNVIFDAVVAVSVTPGGISAAVTDITKAPGTGTTALPTDAVKVEGDRVRVTVPIDLLTTTATRPIARWGVNLWPRSALPPADFHTVASFVPENATFRIAARGKPGR